MQNSERVEFCTSEQKKCSQTNLHTARDTLIEVSESRFLQETGVLISDYPSSIETNLIKTNLIETTNNQTEGQADNTNYIILSLAFLGFMLVWFSVVFAVSISCKFVRNRNKDKIVTSNFFQQVPCRKCQYFDNNQYLQCAVHPSTALTKEALSCSDYCPK